MHRIGDCVAPRKLDHAIYEGELAGRELWSPEERYIYEGELERASTQEPSSAPSRSTRPAQPRPDSAAAFSALNGSMPSR